ncbi:hypothetical protein [Wolbachia endosymbiont (group B) of Villa cingulata]|uniref:hypothetical protein n=1 Tax=Wolbachia endosymbiont (group B) of Villa cingulata TaxID=3066157 RepID=UPI003342D4D2
MFGYLIPFTGKLNSPEESKENVVNGSLRVFRDKFNVPEESDDQPIQHGVTRVHLGEVLNHDPYDGHYWCHRRCESDCTKWYKELDKSMCKARCNRQYQAPEKSQSSEYSSQASDIKSTLENIGDSFYTLADSFSVL